MKGISSCLAENGALCTKRFRGYIRVILGIMEKKMETTGIIGVIYILGLYWGYIGDNGKENGNYYLGFRPLEPR